MIPIDLKGRVAVVTGGAGELGCEMVRALAEAGADVAVCYRSSETKARALVAEVQELGVRAIAVEADVTSEESVTALRDKVTELLGQADIVVCNAVIQYDWKSILEQPAADYESQFKSCVLHTVFMAKAFVPAMKERGWGRVIAINTECAMQCAPHQSAYAAAKRGMDGVIRVLAREAGPCGVTANEVAPGWTISERSPAGKEDAEYTAKSVMQRRGTAREIASAVAFLASDLAGYINGAYIPVCGGNVMPTI
jgi:3-oxoacyl-[acyl-carrier protein] reductase